MQGINFIAIDFETATGKRASICEAGICVVRDGEIVETRSWLSFRKYGRKSVNTLKIFLYLWLTMPLSTSVASVIHWNYTAWRSLTLLIIAPCVPPASSMTSVAIVWITFATSSRYLMGNTIGLEMMRRCVRGCF